MVLSLPGGSGRLRKRTREYCLGSGSHSGLDQREGEILQSSIPHSSLGQDLKQQITFRYETCKGKTCFLLKEDNPGFLVMKVCPLVVTSCNTHVKDNDSALIYLSEQE